MQSNRRNVKRIRLGVVSLIFSLIICLPSMGQVENREDSLIIQYVDRPYEKKELIANTAAISSIQGERLNMPKNMLSSTLYGKIAGLNTVFRSGEPGYDGTTLYIRGWGTYNKNNILVYVDGFQSSYEHIDPQEIETISVLKDAPALVPFGVEGANGVLWITTKRGNEGKVKIHFQGRYGTSRAVQKLSFMDSYDYARLYNEAYSNDKGAWYPFYSDQELQQYKDGTDPVFYPNVNWYDEVLRESAPFYDANISFKGGASNVLYAVFLGYQTSDMLYKKNAYTSDEDMKQTGQFTKYNFRANTDVKISRIFSLSSELGGVVSDYITPTKAASAFWANLASYPSNIYPVVNPNGKWGGNSVYMDNPAGILFATGRNTAHSRFLQANVRLMQNLDMITKGLRLMEAVSFSDYYSGYYNKIKDFERNQPYLNGSEIQYLVFGQDKDYTVSDKTRDVEKLVSFYLTADYKKNIGKQSLSARLGLRQRQRVVDGRNAPYFNQTFFSQVSYDYLKKYYAEVALSYSGSENFKRGKRFGFFPSISGAWILSREDFLKEQSVVDLLKIRLSAGIIGNDNIGERFLYQSYYRGNMETSYILGYTANNPKNTLAEGVVGNPNVTWEKSHKYNVGLDMAFWKKFNASVDVFYDKRTNIIAQRNATVPAVFGNILAYENVGEVTNKGAEIEIDFSDNIQELYYNLRGVFSYARNRIDYQDEVARSEEYLYRTGHPVNQPFGMECVGFYELEDFDSAGNLLPSIPSPSNPVQPGDLKYKDQNNDGYINDDDQVAIGYSNLPEIVYSFDAALQYKNFDLNVFFQGVANRSVYLNGSHAWAFVGNANVPAMAEGRWAYYPEQGIDTRAAATYPRLTLQSNDNNFRRSTFWTKDGSYLRLRNVEIGYALSSKVAGKAGFEKVRLFVGGTNLIHWDRIDDFDAESISGYPLTKSMYIGINIGL